jgi:ATP-dependent RNA helicase DHX8/PRP22
MGINDLLSFDFMDAPPMQTLISAMEQLHALTALDDEGLLTGVGRRVSDQSINHVLTIVGRRVSNQSIIQINHISQ